MSIVLLLLISDVRFSDRPYLLLIVTVRLNYDNLLPLSSLLLSKIKRFCSLVIPNFVRFSDEVNKTVSNQHLQ